MKDRYEKESFSKIVSESFSIAEVGKKLGLRRAGGVYSTIAKYIQEYGLDTSHFTGQLWNFEKSYTDATSLTPLEEVLKYGVNYKSSRLKLRLIAAGLKEDKCEKCGCGDTWQGEPITLELHHINGNHYDNRLENLQILCPNCHSQTSTHRKHSSKKEGYIPNPNKKVGFNKVCKNCGKEFIADRDIRHFCCVECYTSYLHKQHQSKKENGAEDFTDLIELANESSTITELSEKLNISRPSARKMLIKANIYQSFIEKNQDSILHTKPILQYDKNGNFIKEWKSTAEMTKELGIKEIHYVLRGERKTAGGFIWKYKKDVEGME